MNFYKHFIGDYARDTAHLSMLEHAAYRMLLDHYYATERPLPEPAQCERICRAATEEEKKAVRSVLSNFFPDGCNKRADKEIKDFRDYSNAQAMRAHKRWQSLGNASHSHSHSQIKEEKHVGLSPDVPPPQRKNIELRKAASEVIAFLNEKAGRNFDLNGANADHVIARLRDGESVADLRAVVAKKCRDWKGDEKMAMYLRPETLFNRTKFASYKGELSAP